MVHGWKRMLRMNWIEMKDGGSGLVGSTVLSVRGIMEIGLDK
jgi:hypothetical protein